MCTSDKFTEATWLAFDLGRGAARADTDAKRGLESAMVDKVRWLWILA